MLRKFIEEPGIARKDFFIVCILLLSVFGWYYMTLTIINSILGNLDVTHTQNFVVWAVYYVTVIGSGIVGSLLSNRIGRLKFLYLWILLGIVTSSLPALFNNFTVMHVFIVSIVLGVSLGLGMPSCLAYFADCTIVENRGRIGGIALLIINLSAPLLAIPFTMFDLTVNSIIFAMWRGTGLIIFFLKPEENLSSKIKNTSFTSIFQDKSFLLYFVAWFMFCLVDRFETPIQRKFLGDSYNLILMLGPLLASLFAFVGGLLSDWVGRKRVVLYGFATLGISYAIITIVPTEVVSWYFFLTIGSISTGMLWVAFLLILWGDLSQSSTREKYYLIGETPLFIASIMQQFSAPYIASIPETRTFSLAAFFLFIAVLPLLYAPETLPKRKIELRQLRMYTEAARKIKEKHKETAVKD